VEQSREADFFLLFFFFYGTAPIPREISGEREREREKVRAPACLRGPNMVDAWEYLLGLVVELDEHAPGEEVARKVEKVRVLEEDEELAQLARHRAPG
jgi:hypothetical protein